MRKIVVFVCLAVFLAGMTGLAYAKTVKVKGGYTKSGTYRQPHYRTSPNKSKLDNWSTKDNVNPYTGEKGTKKAYK